MQDPITCRIKEILDLHSGYALGKKIQVDASQINRLKRGERKLENISLELALKILYAYSEVQVVSKKEGE